MVQRHPDWPRIRMQVHYGPHNAGKDFRRVKEVLSGARIFFPENVDPSFAADLQHYADPVPGSGAAFDASNMRDSAERVLAEAVYGTGIIVGHIDIDRTQDPEFFNQLTEGLTMHLPEDGPFDACLDSLYRHKVTSRALHDERERQIFDTHLEAELMRIFREHPELLALKDRDEELVIVATMGSYHSSYHTKAEATGITVEYSFSEEPFDRRHLDQVDAAIDRGERPSRDLLAKAYFEELLFPSLHLGEHTPQNEWGAQNWVTYVRDTAEAFTTEEIQAIYEHNQAMAAAGRPEVDIEALVEEKGLPAVPRTEAELEAYVRWSRQPSDSTWQEFEGLQKARLAGAAEKAASDSRIKAWLEQQGGSGS